MRKIFQFIGGYWEAIATFAGVAIMVYEFVTQLYAANGLSLNNTVWLGIGLFVFFGILALMKANRKARQAQNSKPNNQIEIENSDDGIAAQSVSNSPVVRAEGSGVAVGGDFIQTNYISTSP